MTDVFTSYLEMQILAILSLIDISTAKKFITYMQ